MMFASVLVLPVSAVAQSDPDDRAICLGESPAPEADTIVATCSSLLQSTSLTAQDRVVALSNRAVGYRRQQDVDRAIADYNEALSLDPRFTWALNGRGGAYVERGDYARAIVDLTQGIRLLEIEIDQYGTERPERSVLHRRIAYAHYVRGLAHANLQNHRVAAEDFRQGFVRDPEDADLGNGLCWSLAISDGDLDEARAACDASLRIRPDHGPTLDSRGMVGLKQRRFLEAWNDYDAAVRTNDAALPTFLYGRGIAALRLGRVEEGRADIARATQLNAELPQFYARYGIEP